MFTKESNICVKKRPTILINIRRYFRWTALKPLNDSKNISSCEKIGNYSVCKHQLLVYLAFSVSLMGFIP